MQQQDSTDPTGVRDDSANGGGSGLVRARDRKAHAAIEMRKAGASWDDIAQVLGYPTGRQALVATEKTLEKHLTDESQVFMRRLVSQRLDRLLRSVWKTAINEESPDQFAAIDRSRLLIADFRKLHGLDAPSEYLVSTPSQAELERWVSTVLAAQTPAVIEGDIFEADWEEGDDDAVQAE